MSKHRHGKKNYKKQKRPPVDIANKIQQALNYQQSGYLSEAEIIYRDILNQFPKQTDCLHFLGMLQYQRSNNELALKYIQESINLNTENPIFYNNFGLVLENNNKLQEAIKSYQKAIKYKPDYAEAWFNLGFTYSRELNYTSSEEAYSQAIKIKPDYIKALYNLACIQELQSKKNDADDTIKKILKINPDSAEIHNTLGSVFFKLGGADNFYKAEKHFWKAIELKPDYLEAYINIGLLHEEGNNIEGAIKCYEKVLETEPDHLDAKLNLALAWVKDEKIDRSLFYLTQLLENSPKNTKALNGIGNIKLIQGDFLEAEKYFKKIIDINKMEHDAWFGLAQCRKYSLDNDKEFITELKNKSKKYKNTSLYFALGKVSNDFDDYEKAFISYKKGNDIKNRKINYIKGKYSEKIDSLIDVFTKENIDKLSVSSNKSELPIFIIGTPRSGTTLIEQIVSSHPLVYGAGELTYIEEQLKHINKIYGVGKYIPDGINKLKPEDVLNYSNEYLNKITELCNTEKINKITDKMPSNYLYLGYILSILPNSKIIHCKRHPLDTCLSIYFQLFHSRHEYSFDLENLGYWYKDYLRIMEHWNKIFDNKILTIEYNETINNFEETIEKILNYCGLEWDDQCKKFYEIDREVKTASQWQVRQPIYKTSLDRWKHYDKHIGVLKEILAGYY